MKSMTWFLVVVGVVSGVIYLMTTRAAARRSIYGGSGTDSNRTGGDGSSPSNWPGGERSCSHNSGSSSDGGGSDSGTGSGGGGGAD